ncbi:MAG: glyoxalase [Acidobacteria bacterium]|nr:MAG: glyoxalase [Acidobacteriota bacterium]
MGIEIRGMCPLISAFNMPRSLAFYRDVLGFEIVADSGNGDDSSWVWIRLNDTDLMLNDQYEPGHVPESPPSDRQKWHHDTCLYFDADPDAVHEYLISKGLDLKPPMDAPYGMRQLYLNDPDGYNICFQRPVTNDEAR